MELPQLQNFQTFQDIKVVQGENQSENQQQQQQQQQQLQVQQLTFNGQPAIFIPSSAYTSNSDLLNQIQMLMNSNNNNNNNQIYEMVQPQQQQQYQIQLGDNNSQFAALLSNGNTNGTGNNVQIGTTTQNGNITFIQIPNLTSNDANYSNQQQIQICKLESSSNENSFYPQTLDLSFLSHLAQQQQQPPQQVAEENVDKSENSKACKKPRRKTIRNLTSAIKKATNSNNATVNGEVLNGSNNSATSRENPTIEVKGQQTATTNTDEIEHWLIIDGDVNGSQKRKRKACECPNCIKWRQNVLTPEELTNRRTHKCHKCSKEYNKTSHLRAHLRAHDNYRPYACDFKACGKSFTRSDELKRHVRIHNDDRNFPCLICKKRFLRSDHLSKHSLVHKKKAANSTAS